MALLESGGTAANVFPDIAVRISHPAILLVEDEVLLRLVTADEFRSHGYTVIEAANGDEAISILSGGVAVDLICSDIQMPGRRNGIDVAKFAKAHYPHVKLILVSGSAPPADAISAADAFFAKPSAIEDIVRKIDVILGD